MKYRKLIDGDYTLGGQDQFWQDSAEGVAQAIKTRLLLWAGEWFLDTTEGTDYQQQVLGFVPQQRRDLELQQRITGTPGVTELLTYSSLVDAQRRLTVTATVATEFGSTTLTITF